MLLIMNYINQQIANMIPIITILKLLFIAIHTASNFALSLYIMISLILFLLLVTNAIFNSYDKMLYIQKARIIEYSALLFCGTIIKEYILFTKVVLFLNKFSEQILMSLIKLLLFIQEFTNKMIITLKQQNVGDVIIFIVVVKIAYSLVKEAIINVNRKNLNDLCEKICDIIDYLHNVISYILIIILFILGVAMICVLYNYILYLQYNDMTRLQNTDYETLNELLDNHLFK